MARRGGKAATRRSKQRKAQRPSVAPRPAVASDPVEPEATAMQEAPLPVSAPRTPAAAKRPSRDPRASVSGPSRLGERAMAEYHYVQRDLRNIGVLVAVMVVVLVAAYVLFNVVGIAKPA